MNNLASSLIQRVKKKYFFGGSGKTCDVRPLHIIQPTYHIIEIVGAFEVLALQYGALQWVLLHSTMQ